MSLIPQKFRVRLETTVSYEVVVTATTPEIAKSLGENEVEEGGGVEVDSTAYHAVSAEVIE